MRAIRAGFFLFASVLGAYAQLDSDTLTITATRFLTVVPDQVQVIVNVTAPADLALDDILATLRGTGISETSFSSVYTIPAFPVAVRTSLTEWGFMLTTPLSNLKNLLAPLSRFNSPANLRLSFYVQTMPVTGISCPWPALLEDARTQATRLATSAGLKAGPIVSLSDANRSGLPFFASGVLGSAYRSGSFSFFAPTFAIGVPTPLPPPILPAPACSLTVQFKLLR